MPANPSATTRTLARITLGLLLTLASCSEAAKQEATSPAVHAVAAAQPVKAEGRPVAPAHATPESPKAKAEQPASASASATPAAPAPAPASGALPAQAIAEEEALPAGGAAKPAAARPPYPLAGEEFTRALSSRKLAAADNLKPPKAQSVPSVVPWNEAGKYIDQNIVMQGTVVRAVKSRNVVFLNFDQNWKDTFYVVIFKDAWKDFEPSPEKVLLNKTVRVTGKVYTHDKRPQMRVTKGSQVEVIEE